MIYVWLWHLFVILTWLGKVEFDSISDYYDFSISYYHRFILNFFLSDGEVLTMFLKGKAF